MPAIPPPEGDPALLSGGGDGGSGGCGCGRHAGTMRVGVCRPLGPMGARKIAVRLCPPGAAPLARPRINRRRTEGKGWVACAAGEGLFPSMGLARGRCECVPACLGVGGGTPHWVGFGRGGGGAPPRPCGLSWALGPRAAKAVVGRPRRPGRRSKEGRACYSGFGCLGGLL